MIDQENDSDGLVIKIPASIFENRNGKSKKVSAENYDYDFFKRTNIVQRKVVRNREYGKTEVQSLGFIEREQRLKVLGLLDIPALYIKLPNLLDYIYQLGCEDDAEKRYYAAVAISELATKQPFLDLKDAVILPWAKDDNPEIRKSAAVALSQLLKHDRNKSEGLKLLNHWIKIDSQKLTGVALLTFYYIADSYPDETIEAIEIILKNNKYLHYLKIFDVFGVIYENSPIFAINQLYKWILPVKDSDLCLIAGVLAFGIQLDDAVEDDEACKEVAEIIFALWDNPKMQLHEKIQKDTTILIKEWADNAIEKMNDKEFSSDQNFYQAFFHDIYEVYENKGRKNRLEFYLRLWEKNGERVREQKRLLAIRKGEDRPVGNNDKFSYRHLLPQGLK